jgi:hypothetical protein
VVKTAGNRDSLSPTVTAPVLDSTVRIGRNHPETVSGLHPHDVAVQTLKDIKERRQLRHRGVLESRVMTSSYSSVISLESANSRPLESSTCRMVAQGAAVPKSCTMTFVSRQTLTDRAARRAPRQSRRSPAPA